MALTEEEKLKIQEEIEKIEARNESIALRIGENLRQRVEKADLFEEINGIKNQIAEIQEMTEKLKEIEEVDLTVYFNDEKNAAPIDEVKIETIFKIADEVLLNK